MNVTLQEIAQKLKKAKKVALFTHMRPDGDAYGSTLALACALDRQGIACSVCNESDVPSNLTFLEGLDRIKKHPDGDEDLYLSMDSAEGARLGALADVFLAFSKKGTTINVDHHISNTRYAKYNYVQTCSANCMNSYRLIEELGVSLDRQIATYLLVGLLTDSGNFSHDDVTEETLAVGSKLVAAGADICGLQYQLFKKQSKARAALYAKVMSGLRYAHDDRFAFVVIDRETMEKVGADNGATEGFVDFPLNIETVEIAASLLEMKKGQYKVSLRSKKYADVNKLAAVYGGGGHVRAAGCMLFGDLEEIIDKLSYTVSQYLE
ncbi:MAG: bifunctional oligoribonuclease/PAP phosphatase NrnA [Clostridia bacterium]|nr:bifunctional oligoribonuclease/PAP phosphatase NrnA [Clostridia bacterium]